MKKIIEPIETKSLKEVFIDKFKDLILSGELEIGKKLPSERELSDLLQISRPVVHEGLIELASIGLVSMTLPSRMTVTISQKSEISSNL